METREMVTARMAARRKMLGLLGAAGLLSTGIARAQPAPACIVRPQQTEGPYFVDTGLRRADIRSDPATGVVQQGVPLQVTFRVSRVQAGNCQALSGAHVELWHCNAAGVYSGVRDAPGDAGKQKFLRGYQVTDASGNALFNTIYPGWYPGRAVHLHFIVRSAGSGGRRGEFTSQLYFDDALSDKIFASGPYAQHGAGRTRNDRDGGARQGGQHLRLALIQQGQGLAGVFDIGLQTGA